MLCYNITTYGQRYAVAKAQNSSFGEGSHALWTATRAKSVKMVKTLFALESSPWWFGDGLCRVDSKSRFALPARFWVLMGYWYIQKSSVTLSALRASPSRHTAVKTSRRAEFLSLYGGKLDEIFLRDKFPKLLIFWQKFFINANMNGFCKSF